LAGMQQVKATMFVKPIGVAVLLAAAVYVFIMPHLASYVGLGAVLFLCMFLNTYFFDGIMRLCGSAAILLQISVTNPQTYHMEGYLNMLVFTLSVFFFVYVMGYLLNTSRPEKALLSLVRRYFRSLRFLVARLQSPHAHRDSFSQRWLAAFYRHEMKTLPNKMAAWGMFINPALFPATSQAQVKALVASLQVLSLRVETLLEAGEGEHSTALLSAAANAELRPWLGKLEGAFAAWSTQPEAMADDGLQESLVQRLADREARIDAALARAEGGVLSEAEAEQFLRALGGLKGVSEASVAYAGAARDVDWAQWREERFS